MSNRKKHSSKGKNRKSTGKRASSSRGKGSRRKQPDPSFQVSSRVKTIVMGMLSVLSLALILIPGKMVWHGARNLMFGTFGVSVILVPVILGYLTFITMCEKTIVFWKAKATMCGAIVLLTESLVFLLGSSEFGKESYLSALGKLYDEVVLSGSYYPIRSGLLGGVLGHPLLVYCGFLAAAVLILVLLTGLLMIIFKVSLRDIGVLMKRFGRKVSPVHERPIREESEPDDELGIGHYQVDGGYKKSDEFNSRIDIPLENKKKKKAKKKKEDIDIPFDMEDPVIEEKPEEVVEEKNPAEVFFESIDKVKENYPEPEKKEEKQTEDNLLQLDDIIHKAVEEEKKNKPEKEFDFTPAEPVQETAKYSYPPIGLLRLANNKNVDGDAEMKENGEKLVSTLDSFGVSTKITYIARGPSVTRYEIKPAPGVKISKITNLSDDIALGLAAQGVRIEAPIPGKAAVGIEVPNKIVSTVSMRELIDSDDFRNHSSKLACVLGRDIAGQIVITDISKMPHLLIAGTTGSGKSVCMNALLISILYRATPDEVKLLLIDPKMVEFAKYRGIPHLLVPVVTDPKKSAGALNWAVSEMEQRYKIFAEYSCKDIDSYNTLVQSNIEYMKENPPVVDEDSETGELIQPVLEVNGLPVAKEKMPRIVIAIDELADLMMTAPKEVEESIARIAQKARAAGMHLVIATQRPSVNVITGLIKANIPSRISLKVSSNIDSRTILDAGGAEKLIGRGDMLYFPVGASNAVRVQCCFATDDEIEGVTNYIKKSYTAEYNAEIEEQIKRIAAEDLSAENARKDEEGASNLDAKMEEAIKVVIDAGQASTSMLQRRLQVGYARAGRMIDDMEKLGIVGPYQGSKPRDVLMSYNQWLERKNIIGNNND